MVRNKVPQTYQQQQRINVLRLLVTTSVLFFALGYGVIALSAQNLFWFLSNAELSEPIRIIVSDDGERVVYAPGDAEYDLLNDAIKISMSSLNQNDLMPLGLSENTVDYYKNKGVTMEIHYAQPVEFNVSFRAGDPTHFLVPLEGRHAGNGTFFRGDRESWWYGGLRMADPAPLYDAAAALGYEVPEVIE